MSMILSRQNNRITRKMHLQLRQSMIKIGKSSSHLKSLLGIVTILVLSACSSTPVLVEDRNPSGQATIKTDIETDTATPLPNNQAIRDYNVERAEYYERLSKLQSTEPTDDESSKLDDTQLNPQLTAALSAAEHYIQANDFARAEQTLSPHLGRQMTEQQSDRVTIVMAYVAYSRQDYTSALARLTGLLSFPESKRSKSVGQSVEAAPRLVRHSKRRHRQAPLTVQQIDALLLSSFCHQALGDYDKAIANLLQRESGLKGQARAETTRYNWQIINGLEIEQRLAIIESTTDPRVRNRLEQSLEGQIGQQVLAPPQFSQLSEPLDNQEKNVIAEQWSSLSAKRIAVLLPLTSRYAKASQALMDGIKYAHQQNTSAIAPQVSFYDIGDNPYQAAQHYNAAINNGADFIIGPLGKAHANQLNSYLYNSRTNHTPTILLGGDTELVGATHRLTLSPENNGIRVARKAFQDGHLSVALLISNSNSDQRVADAFSREWLNQGGKISKTVYYAPEKFDHSAELKQLFGIYESESRQTKLSNTLGFKPKFAAYLRPDIDFVFMIADNTIGRIIRPQINFYSGAAIPVYADSRVFNGIQNNIENLDLESTQFPVMPWVLRSANVAPYAGQLNQLYALGSDTYRLASNYTRMKNNPNIAINGSTGQLNIKTNGTIDFQPVWASFKDGEAVASDTLGLNVNPLEMPTDGAQRLKSGLNRSNSKASYDDSNWDARGSGRKARP